MNPAAIEINNLHFHYGTSEGSLHDISLRVEAGESVGIVGPNGAGKSTLLLHLNGTLPERFSGEPSVFVGGLAVGTKTLADVRRKVGLVFQDADDQLFCPTVGEDVGFGPVQMGLTREEVARRVGACLERVGLAGFENRSPHRMSGGEKRRACIAGVLACEAEVLALDEPSSNLDPRGRRQLIGLLRELPVTKIIATHDLEMAVELCSRVVVMDAGRVVRVGATREVLGDAALMETHGLEVPRNL